MPRKLLHCIGILYLHQYIFKYAFVIFSYLCCVCFWNNINIRTVSNTCSNDPKCWIECCLFCREVKSLTLVYLRLVTGCVDGKIRIFNFLTGDCLREITAETEAGQILSLHFHDNRWVGCTRESLCFIIVILLFVWCSHIFFLPPPSVYWWTWHIVWSSSSLPKCSGITLSRQRETREKWWLTTV